MVATVLTTQAIFALLGAPLYLHIVIKRNWKIGWHCTSIHPPSSVDHFILHSLATVSNSTPGAIVGIWRRFLVSTKEREREEGSFTHSTNRKYRSFLVLEDTRGWWRTNKKMQKRKCITYSHVPIYTETNTNITIAHTRWRTRAGRRTIRHAVLRERIKCILQSRI